MPHVLVTGGSGFFGGVLKRRLLGEGFTCVNFDLLPDAERLPGLESIQGDLRDTALLAKVFQEQRFDAVIHCAAMLAHGKIERDTLWTSNVDGTINLAKECRENGVPKMVFISTNCLWASNLGHPVTEAETPNPIEIYGQSKLAAEKALAKYTGDLDIVMLRCPTIIDSGRLGLLAILFEFMNDGNTIWVVGKGDNRYQFIYAQDLASACIRALDFKGSDIFHVGSDQVKTLREVYEAVIRNAGSKSRVRSLPKEPTLAAMKLAHKLRISPLGPYHYQMIAEDFLFDTTKAQTLLGWKPTLTNEEMLTRAYKYYAERKDEIYARTDASAHSKPASMGAIRILKWLS
ncbi:NAD(P)-dependent oxidoreductase [Alloacidobacterium dinghuense]|uniref:NAD(P)-dependent oxidoreductase n=1 Tax=Alloacidobacterium dinghuense TaxID=2763107 RepID=A0A7G8BEN4_9BACT|nr:NAD(P)-dependent oxidoreductase [Alloacidobacterium dinghuense]QNI31004.1 NAD(P)-dependent oxidoreductase [Alloacidobacterium dinghuense]